MSSVYERLWGYAFRVANHREIAGMVVGVASDPSQSQVFERAAGALQLIASVEPRRFQRMRRDLRWILFFTFFEGGEYISGVQGCVIGLEYARRHSVLERAMTIVHEATHARLDKMGCRHEGTDQERIEKICVDAEITFASKVPGSDAAIARARRALERPWCTGEGRAKMSRMSLRALGFPEWLARLLAGRGAAAS